MIKYLDFISVFLVKALNAALKFIPRPLVLKAGRGFGFILFIFGGVRRRIGYANLRAVFSKSKNPRELSKMTLNVYKGMSETFTEILCLSGLNKAYVDKYISIENEHYFRDNLGRNKGMIFLTAHFGNWELSGMVSAIKGFPLIVLARQQKMKRLYELMNRLRESKGLTVVRKGMTTRYILKALHENKIIGMVADQNAGANGVILDFLGRPASSAAGPYRFAEKTGAIILPAFMVRIKGPYHRLVIEKPIEIKKDSDITEYMVEYNELLEKHIYKRYDQWLWLHRRWKLSPLKKIVVLSDGKSGHLNQSLAIARDFRNYRLALGIGEEKSVVETIDVKFKNRFWKGIINLCGIFSCRSCQGCMCCLKAGLVKESYEKLRETYADVVISTGFSLAGVNSIFANENNAKNAVCMKPGFLSLNKFDMAVLPRHDVKKTIRMEHVFITDTMPNLIDMKHLETGRKMLAGRITRTSAKAVGVMLGGDNDNFIYKERDVRDMMDEVIDASKKTGADILFTTSRRTSKALEGIIKERLLHEPSCRLLVIANEKNMPYTVEGILGLSDVVIVSGESTSMISEAVASGKKTIVFKGTPARKYLTKHDIFLDKLYKGRYIDIPEGRLSDAIYKAMESGPGEVSSKDAEFVYLNMWRLGA